MTRKSTTFAIGSALSVIAGMVWTGPVAAEPPNMNGARIDITPPMITNETARGNVFLLFDEQNTIGDPRAGSKVEPKTLWSENSGMFYPLSAFIDLGQDYQISDIEVYDSNGTGDFQIESGTPFHWKPLLADPLTNYLTWNHHPVSARTRYLRVVLPDPGTLVREIALYGTPLGTGRTVGRTEHGPTRLPVPTVLHSTMDQLIGTNAFIDDPLDKMKVAGFVREYHNWSWDTGDNTPDSKAFPNDLNAFSPSSAAGGNAWFFDDYYAKLKNAGVTVCPAIQGNVKWLVKDDSHMGDRVGTPGVDPALPSAYAAHADHMFQFAARYGSVKVADKLLKLAPNQPRKSGLGLLHYFENQNEPDGWWRGRAGYSSPYELAAQCSADYDGHMRTMGKTFGVKNADPDAQLVLSGLAGISLDYIKAMKAWADWNRNGDFPADVINVHHYSNNAADQTSGQIGISPEADHLRQRMQEIVDYSQQSLGGRQVWLTEFGYDTNPASVQRAPAIGTLPAEEVQAEWIIRSYLEVAAAGVDRAAQFMLRDTNPNDPTRFATSGLVTQKGEWTPKRSYYYTYTLKNRLAGMRFDGNFPTNNPRVKAYRFRSNSGKGAVVVWMPTSEDARISGLKLAGFASSHTATLVQFADKSTEGNVTTLHITGGTVTLNVSERPVIVLVDSLPIHLLR